MNRKLQELLKNEGENYILPFFWQHGEPEAVLREEMEKIAECGIGAVCVESRPHPDFAGPGWWHDMDIILDEAKKRGMKVWILDDAHFPTGWANGLLREKPDHLRKQYLMFQNVDLCGPCSQIRLDVAAMARTVPLPMVMDTVSLFFRGEKQDAFYDDQLFGVIAARILPDDRLDTSSLMDLTAKVKDGQLIFDVPEGPWRIVVLYLTRNGGGNTQYINVIDKDSCAVLIEAVYEPHYAHYADDFGRTIAGFFSDEPLFGNSVGYDFDEIIGQKMMPLPWCSEMPSLLRQEMGENYLLLLPLLWFNANSDSDLAAQSRYAYMNVITRLVEENFSRQLSQWCEAHHVSYIGHLIEDNNQHARLGCSLGHFFRGLAGQHMSGIDDIGGQVIPGLEYSLRHRKIFKPGDGVFFHFALGKLGSSLGQIDPLKKGRTMCEIFGAYGWEEGVRLMKWLTDHFLVRGVNHFVPHAFSPKEFPDPDCPPHFYARGHNPQFRHFAHLMRYMNRMCHLFNDGQSVTPAAILYHGESEWTGRTMLMQEPAQILMENQIDFNFLPSDVFARPEQFLTRFDSENNRLYVNGQEYRCLIIPTAEYITSAVALFAEQAAQSGFPVIFIDAYPTGICDGLKTSFSLPDPISVCPPVPLRELLEVLDAYDVRDLFLSEPCRPLRVLHYRHKDQDQSKDLFMFFNESLCETIDLWVKLPILESVFHYDADQNQCYEAEYLSKDSTSVRLVLAPYESTVIVAGGSPQKLLPQKKPSRDFISWLELKGPWDLSFSTAKEYPSFRDQQTICTPRDIDLKYKDFSGTIRFETSLMLDVEPDPSSELFIEDANEAVEVWVNKTYIAMKICPPYRFSIGPSLQKGQNIIRIEVTNTLANELKSEKDSIRELMYPTSVNLPLGLIGKVEIKTFDRSLNIR